MSKKKYYIGERLVRTSDRVYTHAVLCGNDVLTCCGRLDLAEKELTRRKNNVIANIKFNQDCLKALQDGRYSVRYTERIGNRRFTGIYKITKSPADYQNRISELKNMISEYRVEPLIAR